MGNDAEFARDLYHGTAAYYDRYRLPYPAEMIADLVSRTAPTGHGRLLDLACGTGQLAFPLAGYFAEVYAVDQEPDMVETVRARAAASDPGIGARIRPIVARAEELSAEPGSLDLVVIGNAFHRLKREVVATHVRRWLRPGGYLALCWSFMPWNGSDGWALAFNQVLERWKTAVSGNRVPARWDQERRELPDAELLFDYGLQMTGRYEFAVRQHWTVPELAGLIRSTSFMPAHVLAEHGAAFDADLAATLEPHTENGLLTETVQYAYELAARP